MSALRKMPMIETVAEAAAAKRAGWTPEVIITAQLPAVEKMSAAKRIALFLAAPFVGLAYIAAMPFVAVAMLVWFAVKALAAKTPAELKKVAMIVVGPLLGLGFIVALPAVGITALGYYALKSR